MAQLSVTFPDSENARVVNALASAWGYRPTIENRATGAMVPNPENKAQFVKRSLTEYVKAGIVHGEATAAMAAARKATEDDVAKIALS